MRLSLSQTGPRLLSAVVFLTHHYADIPFAVCFGYAHCDVWILGTTDIRPVSFAMIEAICYTVRHAFCCPEPISYTNSFTTISFVITMIGQTVWREVNILTVFKFCTNMLFSTMFKICCEFICSIARHFRQSG